MRFLKRNRANVEYEDSYLNIDTYSMKPEGFWYFCYKNRSDWITDEKMDIGNRWLKKYIHKINIRKGVLTNIKNPHPNKLLIIRNIEELNIFNETYGKLSPKYEEEWFMINWNKVSQDYGGIEIFPHLPKLVDFYGYFWYWSFNEESGCIWNTSYIVKNTKLSFQKEENKYVKV